MFRKWFIFALTIVMAVLVASCATATPTPALATKKLRTVGLQLPWKNNGENVVFHVAKKAGYFAEEGLDVNFIEGGPGIPAHVNILSGAQGIEIGCYASNGSLIPLLAGEPPLPFVVIGAILQQHPLAFVALENKLTIEQRGRDLIPADLKGKIVGVQNDTELLALLQKNGIASSDVKIVTIAGENPADLLTQRVDFASYWVVNQPLTLTQPWKALMFSQWGVPFYGDVILTTKERLAKDPELMKAFMRAVKKAMQKTLEDPAYAVQATLEFGGGYEDKALLTRRLELQNPLMQSEDTKKYGLGWIDQKRFAEAVKFYEDSKQIKPGVLKVEDIMSTKFLVSP